jgi:hypothetical protein
MCDTVCHASRMTTTETPKLTASQRAALAAAKVETYAICDYDESGQLPRETRTGWLVRGNENSLWPLRALGIIGPGVVIGERGQKNGRELTAEGIRLAQSLAE